MILKLKWYHELLRAKYYKNTCQSTAIDHAVQCKHRPEFSIEILQNYVADRNDL
jgi:hypothetical protein